MINYKEQYKINTISPNIKPFYEVHIEMDSNDGDYIRDTYVYDEDVWNGFSDFFFLMTSYLANGYSGKFSRGEDWGDYYGHHWEKNKHGFAEMIETLTCDDFDWMQHTDWGYCHSFSEITIYYFDSDGRKHNVEIPSIDNWFDTEEEMIAAMNEAYEKYMEQMGE